MFSRSAAAILTMLAVACADGTVVVSGQDSPNDIAVDGARVYWDSIVSPEGEAPSEIRAAPKSGGAPIKLASTRGMVDGVAVDDERVYWGEHFFDQIVAVPKTGLAEGEIPHRYGVDPILFGMTTDAAHIYWTEYRQDGNGSLHVMDKSGDNWRTLAEGLKCPGAVAVDAANVYWVEDCESAIKKVPLAGGAVSVAVSDAKGVALTALAVDASGLYWATAFLDGEEDPEIRRTPLGGGETTVIASLRNTSFVGGIAVDSSSVWWTDSFEGTIVRADKN